jgi:hypothetical protein
LEFEEMTMKTRNVEDRLAQLAAVVVLLGVSLAATEALANDTADVTTTAIAVHEASRNTLESAREANAEAAAQAAASLAFENWIELEIELEDHTCTLTANKGL